LVDLHEITYKPQELSIEAEEVRDERQGRHLPSSTSRKSAIYSEISKTQLAEIKNIELDGPSFTTKIDTLVRHLLWLRETDPGAKSIIYSQFSDFLDVLAHAFERFRIGFSAIGTKNGIEDFKSNPAIECFLLHARAHASGLNLVNASHVFLCEPLLNTALELQAIARVDRIGQRQETNVWLYLISGTVEESIHQLSVKRRMEHIGQARGKGKGKGKAKETTPEELLDSNLDEANSLEMQQALLTQLMAKGEMGGEVVEPDDLWECLFGASAPQSRPGGDLDDNNNDDYDSNDNDHVRTRGAGAGGDQAIDEHELRNDPEVRRHLGAEAASRRLAEHTRDDDEQ
jgi:E3 ubiquitin-protein ligase SHPRH